MTYAQGDLTYSGALQIGDYRGTARFQYRLAEGDSTLNGPFIFKSTDLQALMEDGDPYFAINGAFRDNLPNGPWRFHFGDFRKGEGVNVLNNFYQVSVSGEQYIAEGRLVEGRPDGTFTQKVEILENSVLVRVPFQSTFNFSRGMPQFSFQIQSDDMTLVGRFLRNGLAHDDWEVFGGEMAGVIERWSFEEGVLRWIDILEPGRSERISIYGTVVVNPVKINLDDRYMQLLLLKYKLSENQDSTLKSRVYPLLNQNARYYERINSIFEAINHQSFDPEFYVRVDYFPLDSVERSHLDTLRSIVRQTAQIQKDLDQNSQLQLLKLADSEVSYLYSAADSLNVKFIMPLASLVEYYDQEIIEFVPRKDLLGFMGLSESPPQTIEVNYMDGDSVKSRMYDLPTSNSMPAGQGQFESAHETGQVVLLGLKNIYTSITEKLTQEQREQKLAVMEEDLILAVNRFNNQSDSLLAAVPDSRPEVEKAIQEIKSTINRELRNYTALGSVEEKVAQVQALTNCIDQMGVLSEHISQLPAERQSIGEAYKDEVWNPIILTVMEEQVKKRIITAYDDIMLPYILSRVENELSCDNVTETVILLQTIHRRMYELRNEDTKRIERKLRKERDSQAVFDLFGIQTGTE